MHAMNPGARIKTRFAPSPTGYLHLGNLRTALFNALYALHSGGVFLLRIEDTDQARSMAVYTQALQHDLNWLGFHWQEGPGVEGPHGSYLQSERGEIYDQFFARLEQDGLAYPCFCSSRELELSRKAQLARGLPPRYMGTCAHLAQADIVKRVAEDVPSTLRFRVRDGETVQFDDLVRGVQTFSTTDIGDFIIRRADGSPSFFFSNAIDDALMEVTHVMRGEDHLTNTPRQILLHRALGLSSPSYGHISMIVAPDGAPLSKRHGSRSLRELREEGYLPAAINNYLARLGHYYENNAYLDLDGLAREFNIKSLSRSPARFDPAQLTYWQHEAVTHLADDALWAWLRGRVYLGANHIDEIVPQGQETAFVQTVRDNITLPETAYVWACNLFAPEVQYGNEAHIILHQAGVAFFEQALQCLDSGAQDFKSYSKAVAAATGAKGKSLFMPLRVAITAEPHGPEMERIWQLMGVARVRRRLESALHYLRT